MKKRRSVKHQFEQGFTLIELMVVISIIGFTSTLIMTSVVNARMKARDARRIADMKTLVTGVELYLSKYGMYPCGSVASGSHQTDGDWLHAGTVSDSFMDAVELGLFTCTGGPTFGLVTDGLVKNGIKDPGGDYYIYDVLNDRQNFILYTGLESPSNRSLMENDNGLSPCVYEVGYGVGTIAPVWGC
jgi:prepilin-type N-terminal cleavage/methylation domain-containing protein